MEQLHRGVSAPHRTQQQQPPAALACPRRGHPFYCGPLAGPAAREETPPPPLASLPACTSHFQFWHGCDAVPQPVSFVSLHSPV